MVKADRNKKIDIKTYDTTQIDGFGEITGEYTTVKSNVWASISPLVGKEYFSAEQVQSQVNTRIVTEYMDGILPSMIVFHGTRKFEIISVIDYKEQHRETTLMCKEIV